MLQDKAMLIRLRLEAPSSHKQDSRLSNETVSAHGLRHDSANVNKRLYPKAVTDMWVKHDATTRAHLKEMTRPWFDDGWRVLPTASYFDVMDYLSKRYAEREVIIEAFAQEFEAIKAAKLAEGDNVFRESDYPADIRAEFHHEHFLMPIPRDFRCDGVDQQDRDAIEQEMLTKIEDQLSSRDLWQLIRQELTTQTGTLPERLRAYHRDAEGKVQNRFYDSLIENVRDLVLRLPKLNISEDPAVAAITDDLKDMSQYDPDLLKENDVLREDVAAKAEDILNRISAFMG